MADAVNTDYIVKGGNLVVLRRTGISDGTGETDAIVIDVSSLVGPDGVNPPSKVKIEEIQYDIFGWNSITLEWDGTVDTPAMIVSGQSGKFFPPGEGVVSDNTDGTGDLVLTTNGTPTAGFAYDIYIKARLK